MRPRPVSPFLLLLAFFCAPFAPAAQQQSAPAPDYSALANAIVTNFDARQFDKIHAQFSTQAAAAISSDQLGQFWDQVLAQAGAFQEIDSTELSTQAGYHIAAVTCAFAKTSLKIILAFDHDGHVAGLHLAPAGNPETASPASAWSAAPYADETKFHEESVTVSDGQWQLPGTLTLPNGQGPFTAVVLISGSGPNDADETIGPNKPFKDLAWGLATNGFAVLRYTKRTRQYGAKSAADMQNFTVKDEYIDDARAAVALLASRQEINPQRIFLAGHSEGGYLAPRIALGHPPIAGIIILEGETRSLQRLTIAQLQYEAGLGGPNAAQIEAAIPEAEKEAAAMDSPDLKPGTVVRLMGIPLPSSYLLDLRGYNPCAVAASLKIPIYITQGGRDFQVTTTDFAGWRKALAGHSNATLKLYPALDHPLYPGTGPSKPGEYLVAGQHVSREIISDLAAWLHSKNP